MLTAVAISAAGVAGIAMLDAALTVWLRSGGVPGFRRRELERRARRQLAARHPARGRTHW